MVVLSVSAELLLLLLDASSGFHDIKPVPEFSPFPTEVVLIIAAIVLAALALAYLYHRQFRKTGTSLSEPAISPFASAIDSLRALAKTLRSNDAAAISEIASQSSLALRTYLEQVFAIPAAERTPFEIAKDLTHLTNRTGATIATPLQRAILDDLRTFEFVAFAEIPAEQRSAERLKLAERLDETAARIHQLREFVEMPPAANERMPVGDTP
ncbi:MAG: hypothetical protein KDD44_06615 [Bdellovibrionales bacterium]|nr:hypothetical protein [Bdellovibrionales bacterium]